MHSMPPMCRTLRPTGFFSLLDKTHWGAYNANGQPRTVWRRQFTDQHCITARRVFERGDRPGGNVELEFRSNGLEDCGSCFTMQTKRVLPLRCILSRHVTGP